MGDAILDGPLPHALGHGIGHVAFEPGPIVHHINHLLIDLLGQVLVHFLAVEDLLAEILGWSLTGCYHVEGLFLESLADNLKS